MNEGQFLRGGQVECVRACLIKVVAMNDDRCAQLADGVDLDIWRDVGHGHGGINSKMACGQGYPLSMIAGRGAYHASLLLFLSQRFQSGIGATQLERKNRLEILALEVHLDAQPFRKGIEVLQGSLTHEIIQPAMQDPGNMTIEQRLALIGSGVDKGGTGRHRIHLCASRSQTAWVAVAVSTPGSSRSGVNTPASQHAAIVRSRWAAASSSSSECRSSSARDDSMP